jgi:hypothetical protein
MRALLARSAIEAIRLTCIRPISTLGSRQSDEALPHARPISSRNSGGAPPRVGTDVPADAAATHGRAPGRTPPTTHAEAQWRRRSAVRWIAMTSSCMA